MNPLHKFEQKESNEVGKEIKNFDLLSQNSKATIEYEPSCIVLDSSSELINIIDKKQKNKVSQ